MKSFSLCLQDDKVKPLLQNLFCCNRLMPEQVLRNDCFLTVDVIPVSLQTGKEYELHKNKILRQQILKKYII